MKSFYLGDKHFASIRHPKAGEKGAFIIDIHALVPKDKHYSVGHWNISVTFAKARKLRDWINELLGESVVQSSPKKEQAVSEFFKNPITLDDEPENIEYDADWDKSSRYENHMADKKETKNVWRW